MTRQSITLTNPNDEWIKSQISTYHEYSNKSELINELDTLSKSDEPAEEANIKFRRSIYFVKPLKTGETITKDHIRRIRPGYGLPPKFEQEIIGKTVNRGIKAGTATSWDFIKKNGLLLSDDIVVMNGKGHSPFVDFAESKQKEIVVYNVLGGVKK